MKEEVFFNLDSHKKLRFAFSIDTDHITLNMTYTFLPTKTYDWMLEAVWSHTLAYKNGHAFLLIPFHSQMERLYFHWGNVALILPHGKQKTSALVKQNVFSYWTNSDQSISNPKRNAVSFWILKSCLPFHKVKPNYFHGNTCIAFCPFHFETKTDADGLKFFICRSWDQNL